MNASISKELQSTYRLGCSNTRQTTADERKWSKRGRIHSILYYLIWVWRERKWGREVGREESAMPPFFPRLFGSFIEISTFSSHYTFFKLVLFFSGGQAWTIYCPVTSFHVVWVVFEFCVLF